MCIPIEEHQTSLSIKAILKTRYDLLDRDTTRLAGPGPPILSHHSSSSIDVDACSLLLPVPVERPTGILNTLKLVLICFKQEIVYVRTWIEQRTVLRSTFTLYTFCVTIIISSHTLALATQELKQERSSESVLINLSLFLAQLSKACKEIVRREGY